MGVVRTVLGDVDPGAIGPVAFHEHVLFDIVPPGAEGDRDREIAVEDRWQTDYLSNADPANAHQTDAGVATAELAHFAADGGGLIVDQSVAGLGRDADGLARASRAAGVHVVAAAGTYTAPYLSAEVAALGEDALVRRFVSEIEDGLDGTDIRAGLIGEIGCSWPPEPVEMRALRAAGLAQQTTGAAISVHPGRHPTACEGILDTLDEAGADLGRVVLCHMDRTHPDGEGIEALLDRGACVEWDFFGIEQSHYWMGDVDLPVDRDRLRLIRGFAEKGHGDRILIGQDICTKTRMRRWGGHGYGHILRNVRPIMERKGFSPDLIAALLRDTPLRLLTLKESAR